MAFLQSFVLDGGEPPALVLEPANILFLRGEYCTCGMKPYGDRQRRRVHSKRLAHFAVPARSGSLDGGIIREAV
jgi:hypothetical protein